MHLHIHYHIYVRKRIFSSSTHTFHIRARRKIAFPPSRGFSPARVGFSDLIPQFREQTFGRIGNVSVSLSSVACASDGQIALEIFAREPSELSVRVFSSFVTAGDGIPCFADNTKRRLHRLLSCVNTMVRFCFVCVVSSFGSTGPIQWMEMEKFSVAERGLGGGLGWIF